MNELKEITNLEQAELVIRRAGIVSNEWVEGKQLLEICGYSTANSRVTLRQLISKHNFIECTDFMRNEDITHRGKGQKPVLWTFTINAANHILLAAMTKEGKQARQEAIDTKIATNATLTGNALLNALIQTQLQTDAIERQQSVQEVRLERLESEVQAQILETCPPNMLSITGVRKVLNDRYGISASLTNFLMCDYEGAVPVKAMVRNIHENANGSSYAVYCKTSITKMVKTFMKGVTPVTATQYEHPAYFGRFALPRTPLIAV